MATKSLAHLLRNSCTIYPDRLAMLVPEKGGHREVTYKELYQAVRRWASGVRSLGLSRGDRICIVSENCQEWALFDWACQTFGLVVVPIYPTLPAVQLQYIVKDCGASVLICGDAGQAKKAEGLEGVRVLQLKEGERSMESLASEAALIDQEAWEAGFEAIEPGDLATIIYTSGTTGLPKGALLAHRNFVWMNEAVVANIPLGKDDIFLSFLPLSHVYERSNGHFLPISLGATIGYSRSLATLAGDIQSVRPTVMLVVPRFLEATRERILDGLKKQKPIQQKLFHLALSQGTKKTHGQFAPLAGILDKVVGKKVRTRFGGRFRFFVSGGAALPRHVYDFYKSFGIDVQQGYGLTETTSGIAVNNPDKPNRPDTVGQLLQGAEGKIAEDGEILLRGPAIMLGYYNLPEETAAAIDSEGWFHTGDIGEFDGEYLKITDRKKDLLVLGNGKNVAPQPIENKLRGASLIAEAVVLGDGMDHCIALIVPAFELIREKLKFTGDDAALAQSPEAFALIKAEVSAVNKTVAPFEMVKRFALLSRPFSIEDGEMTPTLKVKRGVVRTSIKI